jgi:hypothetical protein
MIANLEAEDLAFAFTAQTTTSNRRRGTYENQDQRQSFWVAVDHK